jgi:NADH-quinone oxidoreductase subunit L
MGGLRKYMPITCWTMIAGWLAISGFPFLSGFFSKDGILFGTLTTKSLPDPWGKILWGIGIFTALLTAIYTTRLMVLTFWGDERFHDKHDDHHPKEDAHGHSVTPHESPWSMTLPLIVLAIGAVTAGWIGIPKAFGGADHFDHFLAPAVAPAPVLNAGPELSPKPISVRQESESASESSAEISEERLFAGISIVVALVGLGIGWVWFKRKPLWQPPSILENKYYVDEIYDATIVNPIKTGSTVILWKIIDVTIIDGAVNQLGEIVRDMGSTLRMMQNGAARTYAAIIAIAGLILIGYFGSGFFMAIFK